MHGHAGNVKGEIRKKSISLIFPKNAHGLKSAATIFDPAVSGIPYGKYNLGRGSHVDIAADPQFSVVGVNDFVADGNA